jgi:hypothetical protein
LAFDFSLSERRVNPADVGAGAAGLPRLGESRDWLSVVGPRLRLSDDIVALVAGNGAVTDDAAD